eukprot:3931387-Pleurochrysis_carterae.AAC.2
MEGTRTPESSTICLRGAPASVIGRQRSGSYLRRRRGSVADHANGEVRKVREDVKPACRLHAPDYLLQRGRAIWERDEVRKEYDLQRHVNLISDSVHEIAEHPGSRMNIYVQAASSGQWGRAEVMHDLFRGEAGSEVKLKGMTTGPLSFQTNPRAPGTKQSWPLMKGGRRMRVSGASRMVTRSSRSVSYKPYRAGSEG